MAVRGIERWVWLLHLVCVLNNIGWVAWILDDSVQHLGESEGQAKYKQDESNVQ